MYYGHLSQGLMGKDPILKCFIKKTLGSFPVSLTTMGSFNCELVKDLNILKDGAELF